LSYRATRHARDIKSSGRVAATIAKDVESWAEVGGIQREGTATRIDDPAQRRETLALFERRYA
jgi:uncharacterized protein YhbP (UPF0306 family)